MVSFTVTVKLPVVVAFVAVSVAVTVKAWEFAVWKSAATSKVITPDEFILTPVPVILHVTLSSAETEPKAVSPSFTELTTFVVVIVGAVVSTEGHVPQTGKFEDDIPDQELKSVGVLLIFVTHQLERSWSKFVVYLSIKPILVTDETSQPPISWLKALASWNMSYMFVTLDTFQELISSLNDCLLLNKPLISVTLETSQSLIWP